MIFRISRTSKRSLGTKPKLVFVDCNLNGLFAISGISGELHGGLGKRLNLFFSRCLNS